MLISAKPINKTVFMDNLTKANVAFTTQAKSKIVSVDLATIEEILAYLDIKDE